MPTEREYRSLLECTEFALDWVMEKFSAPEHFECDCVETGGYMEWDTNAYIHTERCSANFESSIPALRDQIRQALAAPGSGEEAARG